MTVRVSTEDFDPQLKWPALPQLVMMVSPVLW